MAAKLKKGDKVVVLAGKDKGKEGEITRVMPEAGKAVVDGVNIAVRHTKQSQNSQGGRIPQAMPIDCRTSRFSTATASDPRRLQDG
jgi:large subunit ribosomal protein L24